MLQLQVSLGITFSLPLSRTASSQVKLNVWVQV